MPAAASPASVLDSLQALYASDALPGDEIQRTLAQLVDEGLLEEAPGA